MQATYEDLSAAIEAKRIAPRDVYGATQLASKFAIYGNWTHRQAQWAQDILRRATGSGVPSDTSGLPPVGPGLAKITAMLANAKSRLQKPAIVLQDRVGAEVAIKLRSDGTVLITRGYKFPAPALARTLIDDSGTQKIRETDEMTIPSAELLDDLDRDVNGAFTRYGHKTGLCCFCRRKLDDERSTRHGYGPVCAGHYNLPWND